MIQTLRHTESVKLDQTQLRQLYLELGNEHADKVISRAIEELAVRLSKLDNSFEDGRLDDTKRIARSMVAVAEQIGMMTFAKVAQDVSDLGHGKDEAALAACMARLVRIGQESLLAVWESSDARG